MISQRGAVYFTKLSPDSWHEIGLHLYIRLGHARNSCAVNMHSSISLKLVRIRLGACDCQTMSPPPETVDLTPPEDRSRSAVASAA
jgi:hypothetical protein